MILHVLILPAANGNKKHENITGANISPLYSMTSTYHESEEGVSDRDFKQVTFLFRVQIGKDDKKSNFYQSLKLYFDPAVQQKRRLKNRLILFILWKKNVIW